MARKALSVLVREWPLAAAALAIVSLALLPRFARSSELIEERERAALQEFRRRVEVEPSQAEPLIRDFIANRSESRRLPEALYLLGRSIVLAARSGEFPGPHVLGVAWNSLAAARTGGFDPALAWRLQHEIARMLDERDYFREAVARYTELVHQSGIPEVPLDLARTLAKRAVQDPVAREALLDEAASRVSEYLRAAPPEQRLRGFLTQADIYLRSGRYGEILPILKRELEEFHGDEERGRLQLELGKALTRLRRNDEALTVLREAERLLGRTSGLDPALLFQAILHQRSGEGESAELCGRLLKNNSALAPVARLVLGLHELGIRGRTVDPIGALSAGLAEIRRPAIFDETGFDFGEFYGQVRSAWEREDDRATLGRYAALYRDLSRLYPGSIAYVLDHARLWIKAGEHAKAADRYLAASALLADPAERQRAVWDAAESCFKGGADLYARAAGLFRRYFELEPGSNVEGLFWQGESLRLARCYQGPRRGEPDALSVFAEFIARARAADPLLARALLNRGRMFAELGMREDAIEEFGRILSPAGALSIDPRAPEFADALRERGRALLELVSSIPTTDASNRRRRLAAQGGNDLREYLDRYADQYDHRAGAVEAGYLLARLAIGEREWAKAMEALTRIEGVGGADSEFLQQARFLKGDILLGQGEWEKAVDAYSRAYKADLASDERLWGLIGRARAYLRLGRRDEARHDFENGKAIYEEKKETFDASLAGRGKDVWGPALEALGKEFLQ